MLETFTVPFSKPFLPTLAHFVWHYVQKDPERLAGCHLFLPTQNSLFAFKEALVQALPQQAALFPKLTPLAALDQENLIFDFTFLEDFMPQNSVRVLSSVEAQHSLAHFLEKTLQKRRTSPFSSSTIFALARSLYTLVSLLSLHQISLKHFLNHDMSLHASFVKTLLEMVWYEWLPHIAAQKYILSAEALRQTYQNTSEFWKINPPDTPVIVAGSTGSQPSTRLLMDALKHLPNSLLIFRGFDPSVSVPAEALCHPQWVLENTLLALDIPRKSVQPLPSTLKDYTVSYGDLFSFTMHQDNTQKQQDILTPNVCQYLECFDIQEEAEKVVLTARFFLQNPEKTVLIIASTPSLMERISLELQAIDLPCSSCMPATYGTSLYGRWLKSTQAILFQDFKGQYLLGFMKHPFFAASTLSFSRPEFILLFEQFFLRGESLYQSIQDLLDALSYRSCPPIVQEEIWQCFQREMISFLQTLQKWAQKSVQGSTFAHYVSYHLKFLTFLGQGVAVSDSMRAALSPQEVYVTLQVVEQLESIPLRLQCEEAMIYQTLLLQWIESFPLQSSFNRGARLRLLSPFEARLQHADCVILTNMNEGNWPRSVDPDPWLSKSLRKTLGVPTAEEKVSLSAYDFMHFLHMEQVVLTRSKQEQGVNTIPSPFFNLLRQFYQNRGSSFMPFSMIEALYREYRLEKYQRLPQKTEVPQGMAPRSAVPNKLFVTDLRLWMQNPYAFYAKKVLHLRPLNALDMQAGAQHFGQVVHALLHQAAKHPESSFRIYKKGLARLASYPLPPSMRLFWRKKIQRIFKWWQDQMQTLAIEASYTEIYGEVVCGDFTIAAIADALMEGEGNLRIVDYKTGSLPTLKAIQEGKEPQMPVEAWIFMERGFGRSIMEKDLHCQLEFWHLTGKNPAGVIVPIRFPLLDIIGQARSGIEALLSSETFVFPATSKLAYNPYASLARQLQWAGGVV